MRTKNHETFELYVTALKAGFEDPVQFALEKTNHRMNLQTMAAKEIIFDAAAVDGGYYVASQDLSLADGDNVLVGFDEFELVELCDVSGGVAVWFTQPATHRGTAANYIVVEDAVLTAPAVFSPHSNERR